MEVEARIFFGVVDCIVCVRACVRVMVMVQYLKRVTIFFVAMMFLNIAYNRVMGSSGNGGGPAAGGNEGATAPRPQHELAAVVEVLAALIFMHMAITHTQLRDDLAMVIILAHTTIVGPTWL